MMESSQGKEGSSEITPENFEAFSTKLNRYIWDGNYEDALPLADRVFEYRSEKGDRDAALVNYASNYYSAASRLWRERGARSGVAVGKYMNIALRALQERIEREIESQGGKKEGMIPVSLDRMTASELDVMQTAYRQAAMIVDKVPLIKPMRQLLMKKEKDPVRDWDAAALLAIRTGLRKVREANKVGGKTAPHTEIFLRVGAYDIAKRYGWEGAIHTRAKRIFKLVEDYPWPSEEVSQEEVFAMQGEYGQAARVARHMRDIARDVGESERAEEFGKKAKTYAAYIPDQKAKL